MLIAKKANLCQPQLSIYITFEVIVSYVITLTDYRRYKDILI